jgi:hypothetical protein
MLSVGSYYIAKNVNDRQLYKKILSCKDGFCTYYVYDARTNRKVYNIGRCDAEWFNRKHEVYNRDVNR